MLKCVQGIQLKGNSCIGPRFQVAPDQSDQKNQENQKQLSCRHFDSGGSGHGPETNEKQNVLSFL